MYSAPSARHTQNFVLDQLLESCISLISLYRIQKFTCLTGGFVCPRTLGNGICWALPDSKVHGANMGPSGSCRPQMGPMLAPWILLSGLSLWKNSSAVSMSMSWCLYDFKKHQQVASSAKSFISDSFISYRHICFCCHKQIKLIIVLCKLRAVLLCKGLKVCFCWAINWSSIKCAFIG